MRFDSTGKATLGHLYSQPDPRTYFGELRGLGYRVPQEAKPYFEKLIKEYREFRQVEVPKVVDIGCSYGINAALLKCDLTMDEMYARYCGEDGAPSGAGLAADRDALLAKDRELTRGRRAAHPISCVGLDVSAGALSYGLAAGFLDDAVHADLERDEATPEQRDLLAGADLVISTGCIGYITERTLTRVVRAQGGRLPWMAHTVLRMFPFRPVERALSELGYETVCVEEELRQRRFTSTEEQDLVLGTMSADGVDTKGLEAEGWLYARLYLSRPAGPQ